MKYFFNKFLKLFNLFLILLFVIFLFLFQLNNFNFKNFSSSDEEVVSVYNTTINEKSNLSRIEYVYNGANYFFVYYEEDTNIIDIDASVEVKDTSGNLVYSSGYNDYISYDSIPENHDPSDYSTWTSDQQPSDSNLSWSKRWLFFIPPYDDLGNQRLEEKTEYNIFVKNTNPLDDVQTATSKTITDVLKFSNDFAYIIESNIDSAVFSTKIDYALKNELEDINIVYTILDKNGVDVIDTFEWSPETNSFYVFNNLFEGVYKGYKLIVEYDNDFLLDNSGTKQRGKYEFYIHDKYSDDYFVISASIYVDFSDEPPIIEDIKYNKITFSFFLYNNKNINLEDKLYFVDSKNSRYDFEFIYPNISNGIYKNRLYFEIYNLDYNQDYEIFLRIDNLEIVDEINGGSYIWNYKKDLFFGQKLTTPDKYPWINNTILVLTIILLILVISLILISLYLVSLKYK